MDPASELDPDPAEPAEETAKAPEATAETVIIPRTTTIEIVPIDDGESTQVIIALEA